MSRSTTESARYGRCVLHFAALVVLILAVVRPANSLGDTGAEPGAPDNASSATGSTTIQYVGSLLLTDSSLLWMQIGGTLPGSGHDQLVTSGTIYADGTLQVELINGYLFDPTGAWNVNDALGSGATRGTRPQIKAFLDGGRSGVLDADGNGTADALSDGILILRYLFDPSGAWNVADALGAGAMRTTREDIKAYLDQFNPNSAPAPPAGLEVIAAAIVIGGSDGETTRSRDGETSQHDELAPAVSLRAKDTVLEDRDRTMPSADQVLWTVARPGIAGPEEERALDRFWAEDGLEWFLTRSNNLRYTGHPAISRDLFGGGNV